jgi:anti-anti-sigma regulatory factor
MSDCDISFEREGDRAIYRLSGVFDRAGAWALRAKLDRETASEVLLDFSLVRDFSDLGVAVVAHGLTEIPRRVLFRGLRQHQLRIFRYCGVSIEETSARESLASASTASSAEPRAS